MQMNLSANYSSILHWGIENKHCQEQIFYRSTRLSNSESDLAKSGSTFLVGGHDTCQGNIVNYILVRSAKM